LEVPQREGALLVRCADDKGNAVEVPVSVDGQLLGNSPLQLKLPIGEHLVEAGGQRQTVRLREKEIETLSLTLSASALAACHSGTAQMGPLADMSFVTIPAGRFQMGSTKGDSDEKTMQMVTLSSFALMTMEVTQAQWQAVMGGNPAHFKGADLPVEMVSWEDTQEFLRKLNQRDPGKGYRLPTEAEWEYACRAGSSTAFCFGDDEARLGSFAWYGDNSGNQTHPVGKKRANAWGLYDMHGNVWEWCQDWYGAFSSGSVKDPQGVSSGSGRVVRGGGWDDFAERCRSANRDFYVSSYRYDYLGFRVARTLP